MRDKQIRALGLSAALIGWSFTAGVDRPWRRHPLAQAAIGTALALGFRSRSGLRPPQLYRGLRLGVAVATMVAVAVAVATTSAKVRTAMAERTIPDRAARWLTFEIPLGTVWSEEMAFRGALATAAAEAFGSVRGRLLQAAVFGLTHIPDARANGESLAGTVAVTSLAGWFFGLIAERSGSLAAPMLAHLAINEAGAVGALLAHRAAGDQP